MMRYQLIFLLTSQAGERKRRHMEQKQKKADVADWEKNTVKGEGWNVSFTMVLLKNTHK